MPKSFAILVCVSPLSIIIFLVSFGIMVAIVQKYFTFVKDFFSMKKDDEINQLFSRQVQKFLKDYVTGAYRDGRFRPTFIAKEMKKLYPDERIEKQNVKAWLNAPSYAFIHWLEKSCSLNIDWLFHGEEDPSIKPIKSK